jgi:hypothetical protein
MIEVFAVEITIGFDLGGGIQHDGQRGCPREIFRLERDYDTLGGLVEKVQ